MNCIYCKRRGMIIYQCNCQLWVCVKCKDEHKCIFKGKNIELIKLKSDKGLKDRI